MTYETQRLNAAFTRDLQQSAFWGESTHTCWNGWNQTLTSLLYMAKISKRQMIVLQTIFVQCCMTIRSIHFTSLCWFHAWWRVATRHNQQNGSNWYHHRYKLEHTNAITQIYFQRRNPKRDCEPLFWKIKYLPNYMAYETRRLNAAINPIPRFDNYFFKIHSNIVLPSIPRPS